jgi:hypothetical protein
LDRGVVAECGTHNVLLASGGLYANMWRHQHRADEALDGRNLPDPER